jgi:lysozyme
MNKTIDDVYDDGLTEEEAYYLCMNDIAIVEKELLDSKPVVNQLTDVRQMVLVDMAFNMGVPRLKLFKNMWLAIEKVNYPLACAEMLDSKWANQVGKRAVRLSEAMKNGEWI